MAKEEDVIYRKGMNEEELKRAKNKTKEEQIKSYANEGAIAGMTLFAGIALLKGWIKMGEPTSSEKNWLFVSFWIAAGATLGSFVAYLEKLAREKRKEGKR